MQTRTSFLSNPFAPTHAKRQHGVVLFVMLMLLIIMSIMVAWGVKMVMFETKIAAFQAFKDQSLNRAENAVLRMESCLVPTLITPAWCYSNGTPISVNHLFDGETKGFLNRGAAGAENANRSAKGYWSSYFTTTSVNNATHNWGANFVRANVVGLSANQQPRVTVERQNQVDLSGFSSDSASQGVALGTAVPFRITANSWEVGIANPNIRSVVQTVIYIPSAAITTPE